jgi:hypothetical protein
MNTATGVIQALQVSRQVSPVALAYDSMTFTVLWSDVLQNTIKSLSLLAGGVEQTFPFINAWLAIVLQIELKIASAV